MQRRVTEDEYLAREGAGTEKSELVNGVIVAMSGASKRHNAIVGNLIIALGRGPRALSVQRAVPRRSRASRRWKRRSPASRRTDSLPLWYARERSPCCTDSQIA